jgi:hypothetical protein
MSGSLRAELAHVEVLGYSPGQARTELAHVEVLRNLTTFNSRTRVNVLHVEVLRSLAPPPSVGGRRRVVVVG